MSSVWRNKKLDKTKYISQWMKKLVVICSDVWSWVSTPLLPFYRPLMCAYMWMSNAKFIQTMYTSKYTPGYIIVFWCAVNILAFLLRFSEDIAHCCDAFNEITLMPKKSFSLFFLLLCHHNTLTIACVFSQAIFLDKWWWPAWTIYRPFLWSQI